MMLPKIVVITGIDGSGKTTQSMHLIKYLRENDKNACLTRQFKKGPIFQRLISLFGPELVRAERMTATSDHFNRTSDQSFTIFKYIIARIAMSRIILTGLSHTWWRLVSNRKCDVIIFDRYFDDVLIKVRWMYGLSDNVTRLLSKLVPTPDLVLHLKTDHYTAMRRESDNDLNLRQLKSKNCIYHEYWELKQDEQNIYCIDSNKSIEQVKSRVIKLYHIEL